MTNGIESLHELARWYGAQTDYYDVRGQFIRASPEALLDVLQALDAPVSRMEDALEGLRHRRQQIGSRGIEPVSVAWDGQTIDVLLRLPARYLASVCECRLELESGERRVWTVRPQELSSREEIDVEGVHYTARKLTVPGPLPWGYHQLAIAYEGTTLISNILAAPRQASRRMGAADKTWGVFIPLYALHSRQSWGAGDWKDLENLVEWVQTMGGGIVSTLPLLAAFLEEPFEPSPYAPASRLFWNEFYINLPRVPEWSASVEAQALVNSHDVQREIEYLRTQPMVDYRRQMAVKRRVLEACLKTLMSDSSSRREAFRTFVAQHPQLQDYAAFRAVGDRRRTAWQDWPASLRAGELREGDYDSEIQRYHLYVQWLADEQLESLAVKARAAGRGLYLDLPLGVHSSSYDVWRERLAFASTMAAGAPPDPFFAKGQNWGFPPIHPERIREQGYRYVRAYLQHHLRLSGMLRIDHMMGLHRLYWIPKGMAARDGVYVGYRAEEWYAIFCLEAHRHGSILVGEDLGTVPPEVRPAMNEHNIHRMYVLQYQAQPNPDQALDPVFEGAVASINTHDMPTFAAFWQGIDIDDRENLGILDAETAKTEHSRRRELCNFVAHYLQKRGWLHEPENQTAVLQALLAFLSSGPAQVILANLEDCWLELHPQNVPGTWHERPNWLRRARYSLEDSQELEQVKSLLREMNRIVHAQ